MPGGDIPRKEGELLKYKNIFSGWAKRYFRLERTYLHYYEHKHNYEPIATITRGEIAEVKISTAFPDKVHVFEIVLKSGIIWYCQAASPSEMVGWMQALSTVPLILDPNKYAVTPPYDESFEVIQPSHNPAFPPGSCITRNDNPSPYQDLHNQAHEIAQSQGYSGLCPNSPPPPYSEQDNAPQFPKQYPK